MGASNSGQVDTPGKFFAASRSSKSEEGLANRSSRQRGAETSDYVQSTPSMESEGSQPSVKLTNSRKKGNEKPGMDIPGRFLRQVSEDSEAKAAMSASDNSAESTAEGCSIERRIAANDEIMDQRQSSKQSVASRASAKSTNSKENATVDTPGNFFAATSDDTVQRQPSKQSIASQRSIKSIPSIGSRRKSKEQPIIDTPGRFFRQASGSASEEQTAEERSPEK